MLMSTRLVHARLVKACFGTSATVHRGIVSVACVAALLLSACAADPGPSEEPSSTSTATADSAASSPEAPGPSQGAASGQASTESAGGSDQQGRPSLADGRAFVGRVWAATHPSASPGTFRIFLPDGTLVMDSCGETYRLARWQPLGDSGVVWEEDTARIEAEVTESGADALTLRLQLVGEVREEHYVLARVPFVCPDSRPSP